MATSALVSFAALALCAVVGLAALVRLLRAPAFFERITTTQNVDRVLSIITAAASAVWLWLVMNAPTEAQMGVVQKIFYLHLPAAYAMYLGFACAAVGSGIYYIWRKERADHFAVAGAEIGLVFALIVLVTGPLWGRKAWGTYWTWDPRLTTTLLIALIFASYVMLRSSGDAGVTERKFASALAILGAAMIPVIHYSVRLWRGQHPQVVTRGGGGLDSRMVLPLVFGFVTISLLFLILLRVRANLEAQVLGVRELQDLQDQEQA